MEKVTWKDFKILRTLGKGSFGQVYLVNKTSEDGDNTKYAMKVMSDAHTTPIFRQAKSERDVLGSVNSPFIIKMFFAFYCAKHTFFVLEYCCGGTLQKMIASNGAMGEEEAKFLLAELLMGLQHLHDQSIVHRDIKLENVMFNEKGHVKIIDFGLSRQLKNGEREMRTGGTACYQAPEIHKKQGHDKRADIWSYGVVVYEVLTGKMAFSGMDRPSIAEKVINLEITFPSFLSSNSLDLIKNILQEENDRIAIEDIKNHDFFEGICWMTVEKGDLEPPFTIGCSENEEEEGYFYFEEELKITSAEKRINLEFYYEKD